MLFSPYFPSLMFFQSTHLWHALLDKSSNKTIIYQKKLKKCLVHLTFKPFFSRSYSSKNPIFFSLFFEKLKGRKLPSNNRIWVPLIFTNFSNMDLKKITRMIQKCLKEFKIMENFRFGILVLDFLNKTVTKIINFEKCPSNLK